MLIGVTLIKGSGGDYHSPPFMRGGQNAVFACEVLNVDGATLTLLAQHKNLEDTTWTTAVTFSSITATGIHTANASGLKEMVRFKYTLTGTNAYDSIHINMLAPAWRP